MFGDNRTITDADSFVGHSQDGVRFRRPGRFWWFYVASLRGEECPKFVSGGSLAGDANPGCHRIKSGENSFLQKGHGDELIDFTVL